jgi:hypothetical protein
LAYLHWKDMIMGMIHFTIHYPHSILEWNLDGNKMLRLTKKIKHQFMEIIENEQP